MVLGDLRRLFGARGMGSHVDGGRVATTLPASCGLVTGTDGPEGHATMDPDGNRRIRPQCRHLRASTEVLAMAEDSVTGSI